MSELQQQIFYQISKNYIFKNVNICEFFKINKIEF